MMRIVIILLILTAGLWCRESQAFWGSNPTDSASGLNVASGFDVNTITTLNGTVLSPPENNGQDQHTQMALATPRGTVSVVLGPWWYWEKQAFTIARSQELAITGSLAQGKDGSLYLFAQKIENRSSGEELVLRSESGQPFWSRGGAQHRGSNRISEGTSGRYGSGTRGNGARGGRR